VLVEAGGEQGGAAGQVEQSVGHFEVVVQGGRGGAAGAAVGRGGVPAGQVPGDGGGERAAAAVVAAEAAAVAAGQVY
jgi:hypothetical protein